MHIQQLLYLTFANVHLISQCILSALCQGNDLRVGLLVCDSALRGLYLCDQKHISCQGNNLICLQAKVNVNLSAATLICFCIDETNAICRMSTPIINYEYFNQFDDRTSRKRIVSARKKAMRNPHQIMDDSHWASVCLHLKSHYLIFVL